METRRTKKKHQTNTHTHPNTEQMKEREATVLCVPTGWFPIFLENSLQTRKEQLLIIRFGSVRFGVRKLCTLIETLGILRYLCVARQICNAQWVKDENQINH